MRYAWNFADEKERFPVWSRGAARALMVGMRRWDRRKSASVDVFAANSRAVAQRIEQAYGRRTVVIHPPVRTDYFTPPPNHERDIYLYVGRLVGYKRPGEVVQAFEGLAAELVVVGDGPELRRLRTLAGGNVRFVGAASNDELRRYYRRARALVFLAEEDFGIAMAEAQACGTPVIGFDRGGAADIVEHGRTGFLLHSRSPAVLQAAIGELERHSFDHADIAARAQRFSQERFRKEIVELAGMVLNGLRL